MVKAGVRICMNHTGYAQITWFVSAQLLSWASWFLKSDCVTMLLHITSSCQHSHLHYHPFTMHAQPWSWKWLLLELYKAMAGGLILPHLLWGGVCCQTSSAETDGKHHPSTGAVYFPSPSLAIPLYLYLGWEVHSSLAWHIRILFLWSQGLGASLLHAFCANSGL